MGKPSKMRTVQELYAQSNSYRKKVEKRFIAYDGEGVTIKGEHRYMLFMCDVEKEIIDYDGLSTYEVLNYICDVARKYPNAIHVCYGASYDVNMLLRDVPYKRLKALQSGEKIGFNNFTLEYRQRKCFIISRYPSGVKHYVQDEKGKWVSQHTERVTLWDVIGFFQGSFVKSLEEFFTTEEERKLLHIEDIKEGKKDRGTFKKEMLHSFIVPYTRYEVLALVKLMERFREYCKEAGITLKRYDGAGAVAASILTQYKVKRYYGKIVEKKKEYDNGDIPPIIVKCSQHAFSAGRIEACKYGHYQYDEETGEYIWHYDIVSAYPSVMPFLPDLSTGKWIHHKKEDINMYATFSLFKIYWQYPSGLPFYPFFYRDVSGVIRYPARGYNWIWYPEIEAALQYIHQMNGIIDIKEQWEYQTNSTIYPYAFVPEIFQKRKEWKRKGIGAQLPLKLGINAMYGKTVQRLGYETTEEDEEKKLPPFFQLQYGGYITSSVRAKMFLAGMQSPENIIAFATDGLWSKKRLNLPISSNLGEWEEEKLSSFTSVQAGVYFAGVEKENVCELTHHYRGFNKEGMLEKYILDAWKEGKTSLPIMTTRFVTLGTGISSVNRYRTKWRTWDSEYRTLRLKPSPSEKRYDDDEWTPEKNPAYKLLPTKVTEAENMMFASRSHLREYNLSSKHILPWEQEDITENQEEEIERQKEIWETEM